MVAIYSFMTSDSENMQIEEGDALHSLSDTSVLFNKGGNGFSLNV